MEFFYTTKDANLTTYSGDGSPTVSFLTGVNGEKPSIKNIYASTGACLTIFEGYLAQDKKKDPDFKFKVMNAANKRNIISLKKFPIVLSNFDIATEEKDHPYTDALNFKPILDTEFVSLEDKIAPLDGKNAVKVFVMNGMGTGLGDGMIGISALYTLHNRLKKKFDKITIDLGHTALIRTKSHTDLYNHHNIINNIIYLPIQLSSLMEYDLVIDLSAMIIRESFNDRPMVDFYLKNMAIDPSSVSNEEKRIKLKTSDKSVSNFSIIFDNLKKDKKKLVMVKTDASTGIRCIPKDITKKLIKTILEDKNTVVVTTDDLSAWQDELNSYLGAKKDRHVNLNYKNTSFDDYCYIISQMDGIISSDTSAYHIADAYDVPSVVIFSTINPDYRIKYYPFCRGIRLAKDNELLGMHVSVNDKHVAIVEGYWKAFNVKKIISELNDVINDKKHYANKNTVSCPICNHANYNKLKDFTADGGFVECANCRCEFSPDRTPENYDEKFDDAYNHYLAENLSVEEIMDNTFRQTRFFPYVDFIRSNLKKGTYLDYGCATGFLVHFTKCLGYDSYGIDISKKAIDFGIRKFALYDKLKVASSIQEAEDIPEKFDIISSFELVEHLPDPAAFGKSVYEKLNPGGFWIFSTPNRQRLQFSAGVKNTKKHSGLEGGDMPKEHLQRFRPETHKFLLDSLGFEIHSQKTSPCHPVCMKDICGTVPDIEVSDATGYKMPIAGSELQKLFESYSYPVFEALENKGNFIITIARKPL